MKIYLGYDERERGAYKAAVRSLANFCDLVPTPLDSDRLAASGLLRRIVDHREHRYDLASNAPYSTDFAISRFLTPILAQTGWALFTDCDVVFMADPIDLLAVADDSKAVMVVKHHNGHKAGTKMDGRVQTLYSRKNWSSVCLYNCDHPANQRLSLQDINERPGRDLHAFYWLQDSEIGELPGEWNWLVGLQPKPEHPKIAHFTLGTPELVPDCEHADIWWEAHNG